MGSLVVGYGLGCVLGLFLNLNDQRNFDLSLSYKTQAKITYRDYARLMHRQGKSFGIFGLLIVSYEYPFERLRGVRDPIASFLGGAFAGMYMAFNRGAKIRSIVGSGLGTGLFIGLTSILLDV